MNNKNFLFDVSFDKPVFFDPKTATEEELEAHNNKKKLEDWGG